MAIKKCVPGLFVQARIVYCEEAVLECHTVLEDRDLVDAGNLIVGVLAIGDTEKEAEPCSCLLPRRRH